MVWGFCFAKNLEAQKIVAVYFLSWRAYYTRRELKCQGEIFKTDPQVQQKGPRKGPN